MEKKFLQCDVIFSGNADIADAVCQPQPIDFTYPLPTNRYKGLKNAIKANY